MYDLPFQSSEIPILNPIYGVRGYLLHILQVTTKGKVWGFHPGSGLFSFLCVSSLCAGAEDQCALDVVLWSP